jgi:hypothetical protein
MDMTSFVVHDARTGEIVHVHVEPADLQTSPMEVLNLAGLAAREGLEVTRVEKLPPGVRFAVHEGRLHAADSAAGFGGAGGVSDVQSPPSERRYVRVHPTSPDVDEA